MDRIELARLVNAQIKHQLNENATTEMGISTSPGEMALEKTYVYQQFKVKGQKITRITGPMLVSGSRNMVKFAFQFSPEWNNLLKTAVITTGGVIYNCLIDSNGEISDDEMPVLCPGSCSVSVFGGDLNTANTEEFQVIKSGYELAEPPTPPEPTAIYVKSIGGKIFYIREYLGAFQYSADGITYKTVTGREGGGIFIPHLSEDGVLSWENNAGLPNPDPVSIVGKQGSQGADGLTTRVSVNGTTYTQVSGLIALPNLATPAQISTLETEIQDITTANNIIDIVQTYAALLAYNTAKVKPNDIIVVLTDETHGVGKSFYKWEKPGATYQWIHKASEHLKANASLDNVDPAYTELHPEIEVVTELPVTLKDGRIYCVIGG